MVSASLRRSYSSIFASSFRNVHSLAFQIADARPTLTKLPPSISEPLSQILKGYSRNLLRPDVQQIRDTSKEACKIRAEYILSSVRPESMPIDYRPDELPKTIMEYGNRESMAYLAWQFPFSFGCIERVLTEIKTRIPQFQPKNILDFGTGPGTAILAVEQMWRECLKEIHGVDVSEAMLEVARKMLNGIRRETHEIHDIEFRRFLSLTGKPKHFDLVTSAFSLDDLPDDGVRRMTIDSLWDQTKDMLVLIERGTPEGSRIISNARRQILLKEGYVDENGETLDPSHQKSLLHIVAPCSHERKCPMMGSWCHFSQRVEMTNHQMEVHSIGKGFVDQKFSYLVIRRGSRPSASTEILEEQSFHWPRLIRRPLKRAGHIINDYCDVDSKFKRVIVPRSQGKEIFHDARKCKWGDLWPHPPKKNARVIETLAVKNNKPRRDQKYNKNKRREFDQVEVEDEFEDF